MKEGRSSRWKRLLSLVMACVMTLTLCLPATASAKETKPAKKKITEVELAIGDVSRLEVLGWYEKTIWSTDNEAVAPVTEDGTVTAAAEGTAVVSAESHLFRGRLKVRTNFTVTVGPAREGVRIIAGETAQLTEAGRVQWTSADPETAAVAQDGTVTGVREGETTVTATVTASKFPRILRWGNMAVTTTKTYEIAVVNLYTVTFASNGGSQVETQTVETGMQATEPEAPVKDGFVFAGWYTDEALTQAYDFETPVTADLTLYAKWNSAVENTYTVTFETNGGSSIESQQVQSGAAAVEPTDPTKEGFRFEKWYTDAELTKQYDFSLPVTKDITLYAKWKDQDDLGDQDSGVIGNEKYVLSADTDEVSTGQTEDITFYVDTKLTVSDGFKVLCNGEDTGVILYDDGNYEYHQDDIPNDGRYTGRVSVKEEADTTLKFTAVAVVGETEITTNAVEISVISDLTDQQLDQMEQVDAGADAVLKKVKAEHPDVSQQEMAEYIRPEMDAYLKAEADAGRIENVQYHEEGGCYSWVYTDSGIENTLFIKEVFQDVETKAVQERKAAQQFVTTFAQAASNSNISYTKGKVTILNYYEANHPWSQFYNGLGNQLQAAGFTVNKVNSVTCADFKNLRDTNTLIMVDTHGQTEHGGQKDASMICTNEHQTRAKNKEYSKDLKEHRIHKITETGGGKVYWIHPKLFVDYYSGNKMNSPIVYLGSCRSYPVQAKNNQLVQALKQGGAGAVSGYSASVSVAYDQNMLNTIAGELLKGKTYGQGIEVAKKAHQTEDPYKDQGWNRHAVLNCYSGEDKTIYHGLQNGTFEAPVYGNNTVRYWERYGDARVIKKLSGLEPRDGSEMSIISSGFGSQNGATTSAIYQTIFVPENAKTIEFSYDVVSEEPMEFVNSSFDDTFTANLVSTDGATLNQMAMESVNSSSWHKVEGINFPGGDDTTYHTRWKQIKSNAIVEYAGQLVVLEFLVEDAGDAAYDTAALIDSVVIRDAKGNILVDEVEGGGSVTPQPPVNPDGPDVPDTPKDTETKPLSFEFNDSHENLVKTSFKYGAEPFRGKPEDYNKDLALMGAVLSRAAEVDHANGNYNPRDDKSSMAWVYDHMEINDADRVMQYNYYADQGSNGRRFCRSVAHKDMIINGVDTAVLFVTFSGTTQSNETEADRFPGKEENLYPFAGYKTYKFIHEFFEAANETANMYRKNHPDAFKKPMKIFISGHSLGGAAANLFAAQFQFQNPEWAKNIKITDIYAYTYGAIDSIDTKQSVTKGYEYIHNIFNWNDTFGPNVLPDIVSAAGNTGKGRFGHIDYFKKNYCNEGESEWPTHVVNHLIEYYVRAINEDLPDCDHSRSQLP